MNTPNEIKILGMIYKVRVTNTFKADISKYLEEGQNADDYTGFFSSVDTTIYLDASNSKQNMESVFIHEIIEAINCHLALKMNHDDIDRLETALHQVLTENKLF